MKFNAAIAKLTLFYVLVIMIINLGFSYSIYRISSSEIDRSLGRQSMILRGMPQRIENGIVDDLENLRQSQVDESLDNIKRNLAYYNLLILLLAGFGSYFFARWTLRPLEEASEEQSRFTADASHELKTPLAAIKSEIEVSLRDQKLGLPGAKKLLRSNLEEIDKLENLSSALLKLSRLDEAKDVDFSFVNLDEAVTEAYEKVESLADRKQISLEAKLIKSKILGDKQSLVELFVILFDNAIKYSADKSKIKVRLTTDGKRQIVSVLDHGIGIKSTDLPHIFDRFYRADQSRNKEKTSGFGIGLSIAKRIVELNNGKIVAKSAPGKGSEFIVTF